MDIYNFRIKFFLGVLCFRSDDEIEPIFVKTHTVVTFVAGSIAKCMLMVNAA